MILKSGAAQCVILLHEIYGINAHMKHYAQLLHNKGFDVYVPNVLQRAPFTYEEETIAYTYFTEHIRFERAKAEVSDLIHELAKQYDAIYVIGFSVGATVAWLCSTEQAVTKVVGCYGSRIRQYTNIVPTADTLLLFAANEASFQPEHIQRDLAVHAHVSVQLINAAHGFMDPFSTVYNEREATAALQHILHYISC